jgi:hypothetical protein
MKVEPRHGAASFSVLFGNAHQGSPRVALRLREWHFDAVAQQNLWDLSADLIAEKRNPALGPGFNVFR